ncbi:hypothetical protein Tco_0945771 [Tanacetum coccineum]
MLAIPDEHLLKFHACKDTKSLWEAIKNRFQKLISQLEIHGEVVSQEDANLKLLRSLPSAWNNIALIMRNKSDLDTLSMDDLYNNLKVYESEIKGQSILRIKLLLHHMLMMLCFLSLLTNPMPHSWTMKILEQIDIDDLEEMDLKWAPRNQGNRNRDVPRRNAPVDTSTTNALVVQDGICGYD